MVFTDALSEERTDVVIMGRVLGTYTGWDQADDWAIVFYDFEPLDGVALPPSKVLNVELTSGRFQCYGDSNDLLHEGDLLPVIKDLPARTS